MRNALLIPLGAGVFSAILHLSVTLGSPSAFVLAYFAQLPLAATGLAFGLSQAAVAAAFAAILVAILAPGVGALSLFILTSALPILLVVHFALRTQVDKNGDIIWYSVGRILVWLSHLGIAAFLVALMIFHQSEGGMQGAIETFFNSIVSRLGGSDRAAIESTIGSITQIFPSLATVSWILMNIINCVLAQRLLVASGQNLRPKPAYSEITMPILPAGIAVFGAILTFFTGIPGFLGLNIMLIASIPFFFIGLAVLHSISAGWPGRPIILIGVYLFLFFALWPAAFIAALGVLEHWLQFRHRAKLQRSNKGNE